MLRNSHTYGAGLRIESAGSTGVDVQNAGGDGLYVYSASAMGLRVFSAGEEGVYVVNAGDNGLRIGHAWLNGLKIDDVELNGVEIWGATVDGVQVNESGRYGVQAHTDLTYGFYTPDAIYAGGGCVGCTSMLIAQNGDEDILEPGDLVAVAGLADPVNPESVRPTLIVRKVKDSFGQGIVGVVEGHYVYDANTDRVSMGGSPEGEEETNFSQRMTESINPEPVAPGEYLSIVYRGLVRVRVDAASDPIRVGDLLSVSATAGHAVRAQPLAIEGVGVDGIYATGTILGKALEPLNKGQGLIWVLVDLQ
ncbi:MAG: hypothetical protein KAJ53_02065 [Anaerolineales bacterium]|nr:hypothetical protein [Anaerolineales bacterium]